AHIAFLASDDFKGRDPGTPEFTLAADYVAAQMEAAGLKPAGEKGTWFQKVPLVLYHAADKGSVSVTRGGVVTPLEFGMDYVPGAFAMVPELAIIGDVVFAGYGITAPDRSRDDFHGLDVRGKIVAMLYGCPEGLQAELAMLCEQMPGDVIANAA